MRIVLWIGNDPNQHALANKIAEKFDVVGIVLETKEGQGRVKYTFKTLMDKLIIRLFFRFVSKTWFELLEDYHKEFPVLPATRIIQVGNINDKSVKDFTESLNPDLICVSGTYLVKKEMLSTKCVKGKINLHTGLSPYIKGGPNCTNWCISTGQFELIGNTIMWIDEGIDSGNLILTEQTKFDGTESFLEIHRKVLDHAHELYLEAIDRIISGSAQNVPQDSIAIGRLYLTREWNWRAHFNLARNLRHFHNMNNQKRFCPKTVE
jgi:methionyl-tRNA formyltransferase